MTPADIVIIAVLAVLVALVLWWNHRCKKRGGCAGGSGCSKCPGKETCDSIDEKWKDAEKDD